MSAPSRHRDARERGFEVVFSAGGDGRLQAVYIRFRRREVSQTREVQPGRLNVDVDAEGEVIGIELLAPVALSDIREILDQKSFDALQTFVREGAGGDWIKAA